jgi:Domain of unknown function (DUF4179)
MAAESRAFRSVHRRHRGSSLVWRGRRDPGCCSGTAYAAITILQSVIQSDPGVASVYQQNLGETVNLSQTRDGVTLTLERAYADVNRVLITYDVSTAPRISSTDRSTRRYRSGVPSQPGTRGRCWPNHYGGRHSVGCMEMGFHILRRAGYDQGFIAEVARVMEYSAAYDIYRDDVEVSHQVT